MTMLCYRAITILFLLILPQTLFANDLGVIGATYPIAETDFIEMAKATIQRKIENGELARWQSEQLTALKTSSDRPPAVPGLLPTLQTRSWLFDPSFTVAADVKDANGHLLSPAGSTFDPLTMAHWTKTLLIFDGDSREQLAWATEQNKALNGEGLLILVNGSIHEISLHFPKKPIYFDQGGRIVNHLQITHVPAIVSQKGPFLLITEVKL